MRKRRRYAHEFFPEFQDRYHVRQWHSPFKRPPHDRYHRVNLIHKNDSLAELIVLSAATALAHEMGRPHRLITRFPELDTFKKYHPWWREPKGTSGIQIVRSMRYWESGAGHAIQRIQRLLGLPTDVIPRGRLLNPSIRKEGKVMIHTGIGSWGHGCQSQLHEWGVKVLRNWIQDRGDLEFVQVGSSPAKLPCQHISGSLDDYIKIAGSCSHYVGIPSGLMHVATAFGVKCFVLVGCMHPNQIVLPMHRTRGPEELLWFYPQNIHFHERLQGGFIHKVSVESLDDAWDGIIQPRRVYPS